MELKQIQAAALEHGITLQGLDAVVTKVQARFGDTTPRPTDLTAFLDSLDVWDKIGMGKEAFLAMPATERMMLARSFVPPVPVHPRRPVQDYRPTAAQQTELDAIPTMAARMTRYRQLRDEAAQAPPQAG